MSTVLAAAKKSRQSKLLHKLESASSLMKEDSEDTSPKSYSLAGFPVVPPSHLGETSTSSFNSRNFKLNVRKFMSTKVKSLANKALIDKIRETVQKIVDKQV
jgi:hypothetical protein